MKILLTGANGQLGSDLRRALTQHNKHDLIATTRQDLDVTNPAQTREVIAAHKPDVVLNTTAFNKVDAAESDAGEALRVNAFAAQQLALACREGDIPLMHISTDFVFDGAKRAPYIESDLPNPLSAYGASKHAGELLVRAAWPKHYIVRTCGLYGVAGSSGKGGNFVNTMLRLARENKPIKVVGDQICTPTSTQDLAAQLAVLIETNADAKAYGTYHANNHGACSWHEFAAEIFRLAGLQPDLIPITSQQFGAPATRPPYSVLQNAALHTLGIDHMRDWHEALAEYIGN
jgi:dTDP-4-dehydrorhamnose reductase